MGRPLNKRYFGTPTDGKNDIKVKFWNGSAEVAGYIVKQMGTKKFRVTADGTTTFVARLRTGACTAPGEMRITVQDDAAAPHDAIKVAGHKITYTDAGTNYSIGWTFNDSTADEKVEMPEAATPIPVALPVADGSFVIGTEYEITTVGTTTLWTEVGAVADTGNLGEVFVATATGTGTPGDGEATPTPTVDAGDSF